MPNCTGSCMLNNHKKWNNYRPDSLGDNYIRSRQDSGEQVFKTVQQKDKHISNKALWYLSTHLYPWIPGQYTFYLLLCQKLSFFFIFSLSVGATKTKTIAHRHFLQRPVQYKAITITMSLFLLLQIVLISKRINALWKDTYPFDHEYPVVLILLP
jgi:hypothetical protein